MQMQTLYMHVALGLRRQEESIMSLIDGKWACDIWSMPSLPCICVLADCFHIVLVFHRPGTTNQNSSSSKIAISRLNFSCRKINCKFLCIAYVWRITYIIYIFCLMPSCLSKQHQHHHHYDTNVRDSHN